MFRKFVAVFGGVSALMLVVGVAMAGAPHNDGIYSDPGNSTYGADLNVGGEAEIAPSSEVLPVDPIPEPGTLVLVGSGLVIAARFARKRAR